LDEDSDEDFFAAAEESGRENELTGSPSRFTDAVANEIHHDERDANEHHHGAPVMNQIANGYQGTKILLTTHRHIHRSCHLQQ
jgi:hypothetical protein